MTSARVIDGAFEGSPGVVVRSFLGILSLCVGATIGAGAAVAGEASAATVRWDASPEAGTVALVLEFSGDTGAIEARMGGSGLEVVLLGTTVAENGLPSGVKAIREEGGTRLRLERQGLVVRSVRLDRKAATIVMNAPSPDSTAASGYAVGVGDVLTVSVYSNADLSGDFTVGPDGTIAVPLVGPFPVSGRTEAAITAELTARLADKFLVDPQVSVTVKTYQSQFVYVTGAVPRASRVAIRPGMTLRGALAEAGAALSPGMSVELRRATRETSMLDGAALDSASAPLPKDGDVLTVQQSNYVSIYGEVRRANRLAFTPDMTLLQAIAMAEGLTDWANKKKIQILRKGPGGTETVAVNLNAVEKHEIPDPPLQPEDVIIVGRRFL